MSSLEPITLYGHATGPNPWKTAVILEELKLPYETKMMGFADLKKPPYNTEVNPNGRVPAIIDPNTDLTIWESAAINQYLIETYDKDDTISYSSGPEKYLDAQWVFFQASGQGPYYGQAAWFEHFHGEKVPSAIDRYVKEVERVISVLDNHLKARGTPFLVGTKCTWADLSFITWHTLLSFITKDAQVDLGKYPHYDTWMKTLLDRPTVKKVLADKAKASGK